MKKLFVPFVAMLLILITMDFSFAEVNHSGSKAVKSSKSTIYNSGKQTQKYVFKAVLTGRFKSPAVKTKAKGHVVFIFSKDGKELSYKLYVYDIDSVAMAHIHHGTMGKEGQIAAWLYKGKITGKFNGLLSKGVLTNKDINLDSLRAWIKTGHAYVLVHTQMNPNGEIGGLIK